MQFTVKWWIPQTYFLNERNGRYGKSLCGFVQSQMILGCFHECGILWRVNKEQKQHNIDEVKIKYVFQP